MYNSTRSDNSSYQLIWDSLSVVILTSIYWKNRVQVRFLTWPLLNCLYNCNILWYASHHKRLPYATGADSESQPFVTMLSLCKPIHKVGLEDSAKISPWLLMRNKGSMFASMFRQQNDALCCLMYF